MSQIIKPKNDTREYIHMIMPNELEMIYIYDKDSVTAAVSLCVNIGQYEDPVEYPGIAHFLEHMLFMGTLKYPDINHFMSFLNKHGGLTNAYTSHEITNYFFNIQIDDKKINSFIKCLDIFGHFFIDPLFEIDAVTKEINAVDSEHSKNIASDDWRTNRLIKEIAFNTGPFHKFGTGNSETLKKDNIRDILLEFYEKYYSANLMKLVISSPYSFNEIKNDIINIFSQIKNKNVIKNIIPNISLNNKLVQMVPIEDKNKLHILWKLPCMRKYYKYKLTNLLCLILGSESINTLSYYLKRESYCNQLSAHEYDTDESMTLIEILIELTDKGFENIPLILSLVYQYINVIANTNPENIRQKYEETRKIGIIDFEYAVKINPEEYVPHLCPIMFFIEPSDIKNLLYRQHVPKRYSDKIYDITHDLLQNLVPINSIIIVSSKSYQNKTDKTEKWYGIHYKMSDLDINHTNNDTHMLYFPKKNKYIPKHINILSIKANPDNNPKLILDTENNKLFYKKDNEFNFPKILLSVVIYNKGIYDSITNYTFWQIFIKLLIKKHESQIFEMDIAGSTVSIKLSYNTITFQVNSYNDIIGNILEDFTNMFNKSSDFTLEEFELVKNMYTLELQNNVYLSPYVIGNMYLDEKSMRVHYTFYEILDELKNVNYTKFSEKQIQMSLLGSSKIIGLIQGNCYKENAIQYITYFNKFIKKNKYAHNTMFELDALQNGDVKIYTKKSFNKCENDSSVCVFYEIGKHIIDSNDSNDINNYNYGISLLMLIHNILKEQFFHQLRTIDQCGYIVTSNLGKINTNYECLYGEKFIIQSAKISPKDMRSKIMKFIKKSLELIKDVTDDILNKYRKIVITELFEPNHNIYEEFYKNLYSITNNDYEFNNRQKIKVILNKITRTELVKFYENYFVNKTTRKIRVVEIYSKSHIEN